MLESPERRVTKWGLWPRTGYLLLLGGLLAALGVLLSPRVLGSRGASDLALPLSLVISSAGSVLLLVAIGGLALAPGQTPAAARRSYGSHLTAIGLTLLAGVGSLAIVLPVMLPTRHPSVLGFLLSAVVLDVLLVAIVYFRVVRPGIMSWRDIGLSRDQLRHSWQAGLTAAPVLFLVATMLELTLKALGVRQTQLEGLSFLHSVPFWQYALVAFAAAVLAPIAEEIYFRGYVFRACLQQKGPLQAYLFSSLLFAVVHLNLQALLPIFVMGLFLAYLCQRTGSVAPGIIAHAFINAVAFTVLYFAT